MGGRDKGKQQHQSPHGGLGNDGRQQHKPSLKRPHSEISAGVVQSTWKDIDIPFIGLDEVTECHYFNLFPMEKSNENWTNDMRSEVVGLAACVQAETTRCKLEKADGYATKGAQRDPYYILKQQLRLHKAHFATTWKIDPADLSTALDFVMEVRNAQAHNDRDARRKLDGKKTHNQKTVLALADHLRMLLKAAALSTSDPEAKKHARAKLETLQLQEELYVQREKSFAERSKQKLKAIAAGELKVKLPGRDACAFQALPPKVRDALAPKLK